MTWGLKVAARRDEVQEVSVCCEESRRRRTLLAASLLALPAVLTGALAGKAAAGTAYVTTSVSSVSFGAGPVGALRRVAVTVTAQTSVGYNAVSLIGVPSSLTVSADTCTGRAMSAGQTCVVSVDFAPSGPGPVSGTLRISYNGPGSAYAADLPVGGSAVTASRSSGGDTTAGHNDEMQIVSGTTGVAQRFTASVAGVVSEASAWISAYDGDGALPAITAELRSEDGGPGVVLASVVLPKTAVGTGLGSNVRFVFPNPAQVTAGQHFYLALSSIYAGSPYNEYRWWGTSSMGAEQWYAGYGSAWGQVTNGRPARAGSATVLTPDLPSPPTQVSATSGNGRATVSWSGAVDHGSPITAYTVTAVPGGVTSTTAGATNAVVSGLTNGTSYTFSVTATNGAGTGTASPPSPVVVPTQPFSDVPPSSQFAGEIDWLTQNHITNGFADGTFRPAQAVTRQAFAAYLYRYAHAGADAGTCPAGTSTFSDVPDNTPFCGDVAWLAGTGITGGFPDGGFHPSASVSRQAAAAFFFRYNHAGSDGGTCPAGTSPFPDVADGSAFCGDIKWLATTAPLAITSGFADGGFHPTTAVTRQAAAAYFYRYDSDYPQTTAG